MAFSSTEPIPIVHRAFFVINLIFVKYMVTEHTERGLAAETAVADQLRQRGFRILDRNWRRPWGELDVIAEHGGIVHFVEVKASRTSRAGFDPFLRANHAKMRKVTRTARSWLAANRYGPETEWQLDIASVIMEPQLIIEIFENV